MDQAPCSDIKVSLLIKGVRRQRKLDQRQQRMSLDNSVTLAMNAEPPPAVGSIEPLKVLPSHTS